MSALKQIIDLLPKLDSDELSELRKRITALSSLGGSPEVDGKAGALRDTRAEMIMEAINHVMSSLGADSASVFVMRRTADYPRLKQKVDSLFEYMRKITGNRVEQQHLLNMSVEMLYQDLVELGIPVTALTIMRHIHRIPAVMNKQFPGYAEAGVLSMILKGNTNVRK